MSGLKRDSKSRRRREHQRIEGDQLQLIEEGAEGTSAHEDA